MDLIRIKCSISGTIFESTKLALPRWFLAMHLLTQSKNNVAALELMRHLGVCYKTTWLSKRKLMEVMRVREDDRQLDGRVEIDDAYVGGERSGGKTAPGSENKVPFVAAVQTTPDGQPQFVCVRADSNLRGSFSVGANRPGCGGVLTIAQPLRALPRFERLRFLSAAPGLAESCGCQRDSECRRRRQAAAELPVAGVRRCPVAERLICKVR
jgi:hypothetical protein